MGKKCRQLLDAPVANTAAIKFAYPYASARESTDAYGCLLGANWAEDAAHFASGRKMSAAIRRCPHCPATSQCGKQLRLRPHGVRRSVAGAATLQSAEWWSVIDAHVLACGATRVRSGEGSARMRERLISTPADLKETKWDFPAKRSKRQPVTKLWLCVRAKNVREADVRGRGISKAQWNPQKALQQADMWIGNATRGSSIGRIGRPPNWDLIPRPEDEIG